MSKYFLYEKGDSPVIFFSIKFRFRPKYIPALKIAKITSSLLSRVLAAFQWYCLDETVNGFQKLHMLPVRDF